MPSQHKNPLLGWRPPAGLSAWVRAEAERRQVGVGVILTEALEAYRAEPALIINPSRDLTADEIAEVRRRLDDLA